MLSRPVVDLAARLADITPAAADKALLLTTGAEANEAALKMAKLVHRRIRNRRLRQSWHGMTSGAAVRHLQRRPQGVRAGRPRATLPSRRPNAYRSRFRPDGDSTGRRELDYGFDLVDRQSTGSLAACIVEPILSSGGSSTCRRATSPR